MKKKNKIWLGFTLTSALLTGTSLGGYYYTMEHFEPALYHEERIVINGDTLSQAEFAERIEKENGVWYYQAPEDSSKIDLYALSDYKIKGDRRYRLYQNLELEKSVDTILVKRDNQEKKLYYFYGPNDSISNLPSMGSMDWNKLNIRHFVSDDPKIQAQLEIYNNALNCTEDHEKQHFKGAQAGLMRSGRSYETVFGDNCMDEVAANIAQLMRQRRNYQQHGEDEKYITPRFNFYKEWLKKASHSEEAKYSPSSLKTIFADTCMCEISDSIAEFLKWRQGFVNKGGQIPLAYKFYDKWLLRFPFQAENISVEEAAFIANGVFDSWKKEKFPIYIKRNADRAIYILREANYNGCQDNPKEHAQLMHQVFLIEGIDFYQFIEGREQEFINDLPQKQQERFSSLLKIKKNQMSYFEKVGQLTQNSPTKKDLHFQNVKRKHEWNKLTNKILGRER